MGGGSPALLVPFPAIGPRFLANIVTGLHVTAWHQSLHLYPIICRDLYPEFRSIIPAHHGADVGGEQAGGFRHGPEVRCRAPPHGADAGICFHGC